MILKNIKNGYAHLQYNMGPIYFQTIDLSKFFCANSANYNVALPAWYLSIITIR